jgi:GT2 family glycosyltransferase
MMTGSPQTSPLLSILILHYNADTLRDCLTSLWLVASAETEVVLVDNGSERNVARLAEAFGFVRYVRADQNLGFAGGNNFGLSHCRGKYVLLLNDDVVVNGDFAKVLSTYLDQHPQVGIVQGKMILPRFDSRLDVCGSFLTRYGLPYNYGFLKTDEPKYQASYPVFCGKGACLMFRREIIDRIGGFLFDDDFFCYYEESDFCHRAWIAGYEVHFVPSPPIQHFMGSTSGASQSSFVLRYYLRNMAFSLLSNLSFSSRLRILPLFFLSFLISMVIAALMFKWSQFAAHWGAITYCALRYGKIVQRRRVVKEIRVQSDRQIFAKVLRTPRLEYFVKTLRGQLSTYADEELPQAFGTLKEKRI